MIIELIGTWLLVGFVSAVGWNVADETVNKPYIDPYLAKKWARIINQRRQMHKINNNIPKTAAFTASFPLYKFCRLCYNLT